MVNSTKNMLSKLGSSMPNEERSADVIEDHVVSSVPNSPERKQGKMSSILQDCLIRKDSHDLTPNS